MTVVVEALSRPNGLRVPASKRNIYQKVSLNVSGADGMNLGKNFHHYLSVGLSALTAIEANKELAEVPGFKSILDFGSGAGRVTRWMRAAYPDARITAADIRRQDLDFCASQFGTLTWETSTDLEGLEAPQAYDLIWMGSVITHLSADRTKILLKKALSWCNPNGLMIASFHGRPAYSWRLGKYIDPSKLPEIEDQYKQTGYGYVDYPNQVGYGISFTDPSWLISEIKQFDCRIVSISERAWDNHHDVLALQRV